MPEARSYGDVHTDGVIGAARPRRNIRRMLIRKIDAVDRPAQEGATAVILKRADPRKGIDMDEQEMRRILRDEIAKAAEPSGEDAPEGDAPTDEEVAEFLEGVQADFLEAAPDELAKAYGELPEDEAIDVLVEFAEDPDSVLAKMAAADEALEEAAEASAEPAEGPITGADIDSMDEAGLREFAHAVLAGEAEAEAEEGREEVAKAIAGTDETVDDLRKSVEALVEERSLHEADGYAREHLATIPGTDIEKRDLAYAINALPPAQREQVEKALDTAGKATGLLFREEGTILESGSGQSGELAAISKVHQRAAEIMRDEKVDEPTALAKAYSEPQGVEAYEMAKRASYGRA